MASEKEKSVGYVPFTDQDAYPPAKDQYNAVPPRPASRPPQVSRQQHLKDIEVITGQPVPVITTEPKRYFWLSLLNMSCCCPILGAFAFEYSNVVNLANATSRFAEAEEASRNAKRLNIIGISIGAIVWAIVVISFIVLIATS